MALVGARSQNRVRLGNNHLFNLFLDEIKGTKISSIQILPR